MIDLPETLTDRQRECWEAYEKCNRSDTLAARELGIDIKALRSSLWLAHVKGAIIVPDKFSPAAPAGWECNYSTVQHDGQGNVKQQWDRVRPAISTDELSRYLSSRLPVSKIKISKVSTCNENLMLEWPIFDAHHGMLAWEKETGNDYDTKISRHLQVSAAKILYESFGRVAQTTIVFGGDTQTSDNRQGKTEKSGHIVSTDSRYQKIAWCAYETAFSCIDIAAQFSKKVLVVVIPGNHDNDSSYHLAISLHAHYRNCENIEIDISPKRHKFYSWGKCVFFTTHGELSSKRIAPFALQQAIREGHASNPDMRLYVRMGHLHKRETTVPDMLTEQDGVIIERWPTLAGQEAYSIEGAYTSCRATAAKLWHSGYGGHFGAREITVGEILEKYPIEDS